MYMYMYMYSSSWQHGCTWLHTKLASDEAQPELILAVIRAVLYCRTRKITILCLSIEIVDIVHHPSPVLGAKPDLIIYFQMRMQPRVSHESRSAVHQAQVHKRLGSP